MAESAFIAKTRAEREQAVRDRWAPEPKLPDTPCLPVAVPEDATIRRKRVYASSLFLE